MLGKKKEEQNKTAARDKSLSTEAQKFHFNKFIIHANLSNVVTLNHRGSLSVMGDAEF